MNRIETGTTGERWIRCALFIGMFSVFGGWFAYDGWVKYPSKNLEAFKQELPKEGQSGNITINPRVTLARVVPFKAALRHRDGGVDPQAKDTVVTPNQLVTALGDPAFEDRATGHMYFIGPALLVVARPVEGKLRLESDLELKPSKERTEKDIQGQKSTAIILAVVVVIALIQLVRILTTCVIVDDQGLNYNGKAIAWDAMTGLDASRYREKGWVDLEYKSGEEVDALRLDNYKIREFEAVVTAICERKGFANPITAARAESEHDAEPDANA